MKKTNVMRLLDISKLNYQTHFYENEITDGEMVAVLIKKAPERVFKTLVTIANNKKYFVYLIPVNTKLDLKKAAKKAQVKSIEMIKQKDLLPLKGYVHGGCSPIGMKDEFKTFIDESAILFPTIIFSAGKIGCQIEMNPVDLIKYINGEFSDLTISKDN